MDDFLNNPLLDMQLAKKLLMNLSGKAIRPYSISFRDKLRVIFLLRLKKMLRNSLRQKLLNIMT